MLGVPAQATIAPDGSTVFFVRTRSSTDPVSCLWALDCLTWSERLLADPLTLLAGEDEDLPPQEQTRRERSQADCRPASSPTPPTTPASCSRSRSPGSCGPSGQPAARCAGWRPPSRSSTRGPTRPASGSPTSAAARCGSPRPMAARTVAVAVPDGPEIGFGLAEHVAAESMGRHRGYWWAPDGTAAAGRAGRHEPGPALVYRRPVRPGPAAGHDPLPGGRDRERRRQPVDR